VNIGQVDAEVVDLVQRAQDGDRDAFAAIYDRYLNQVYGFVYRRVGQRALAEDLTADVFLRALKQIGRFTWQGVDIGAWLLTIARNRIADHFKSARVRREHNVAEVRDSIGQDPADDPERVTIARDDARALGSALSALKDDHREVLELRFVHGMSVAETGLVMNRTEGAIKALQYRALRSLTEIVHRTGSSGTDLTDRGAP